MDPTVERVNRPSASALALTSSSRGTGRPDPSKPRLPSAMRRQRPVISKGPSLGKTLPSARSIEPGSAAWARMRNCELGTSPKSTFSRISGPPSVKSMNRPSAANPLRARRAPLIFTAQLARLPPPVFRKRAQPSESDSLMAM